MIEDEHNKEEGKEGQEEYDGRGDEAEEGDEGGHAGAGEELWVNFYINERGSEGEIVDAWVIV